LPKKFRQFQKAGGFLFLIVCLNPTLQKTYMLPGFTKTEVMRTAEHYLDIAGKGVIVTRALTLLGENAIHLTHLGGAFREYFLSRAAKEGIAIRAVGCGAEIRFCTTLLDGKGMTAEIVEDGCRVEPALGEKVMRAFRKMLPQAAALVIAGSKATGYPDTVFPEMVGLAKKAGKLVFADIRGEDLHAVLPCRPDIIKPNRREFVETFFPAAENPPPEAVGEKLMELYGRFGVKSVLTDGDRDILFSDGKLTTMHPVTALYAINTTGCGDVFTAGLVCRYARVRDLAAAVAFGAELAGENALCVRPGFIKKKKIRILKKKICML
jgi:1-phosphofructokinase